MASKGKKGDVVVSSSSAGGAQLRSKKAKDDKGYFENVDKKDGASVDPVKNKKEKYYWEEDTWSIIDRYFDQEGVLARCQIDSYNDFVDNIIPCLIKNHNPIDIGHPNHWDATIGKFRYMYQVEFDGQPYMSRPQINEGSGSIQDLYPYEARLRNLSYSAHMYIDVTHRIMQWNGREYAVMENPETKEPMEKRESRIPFKLPAMLHSKYCYLYNNEAESLKQYGECPFDLGGYFIINGSEKVIISQERPVDNKILCFKQKEHGAKDDLNVEIRSTIDQRFYPVRKNDIKLTMPKEGEADQYLRISFPYLNKEIPLMIVFRALGIISEKEIMDMILGAPIDRVPPEMIQLILPSFEETVSSELDGTGEDGGSLGVEGTLGVMGTGSSGVGTGVASASAASRKKKKIPKTKITTQHDALLYISNHISNMNMEYLEKKLGTSKPDDEKKKLEKAKYVMDILRRDLLPHMGENFRLKSIGLGYMTNILLRCKLGLRNNDVRDHYANKRLDLAGPLLKKLFQGSFGRLIKDIKKEVSKTLETDTITLFPGLRKVIQNCNMEAPIRKALSTGDWSTGKGNPYSSTQLGIAQVLQRPSYLGYLSYLRRVQTPMEKSGNKITEPRKLDATQFGLACPNETPEGHQVGIVKNLGMMTSVTITSSIISIKAALKKMPITPLSVIDLLTIHYQTKVFLNGEWIGCTTEVDKIYNTLKAFKRDGTFNPMFSISRDYEQRELNIRTDGGRYTRPLYVVDYFPSRHLWIPKIAVEWAKAKDMSWKELISNGYIEFLDAEETENAMIAMTPRDLITNSQNKNEWYRYTHLELHPAMMHGVVAQMIPFCDHNMSPRNCFQCLEINAEVWMFDGTKKKIKDIEVGDYVLTVDPKTLEVSPAKVINQYVKETEKRIVKLTYETGRYAKNSSWYDHQITEKSTLIATEDHPVLTYTGWKMIGTLTEDDQICVAEEHNLNSKIAFCQVISVEEHPNVMIADITIDKESHSFIVGSGIVVHNSAMGKQAIGLPYTNINSRMDAMANILCYPMTPLVQTRTMKYTNMDKLPHGQQCIVAVACYMGYNQEDSLLINKGFIERGGFNSIHLKTYVDDENPHKSSTAESEQFGKPEANKTQGMKPSSFRDLDAYRHLDDEGFAKLGAKIEVNDVIIGKTIRLEEPVKNYTGQQITHTDISTQAKQGDDGYVDLRIPSPGSVKNLNNDNNRFAKIRIAEMRKPVIGDKLASRSAQKGTIGMILPEEDMPFTDYGMTPDLVMNPHAYPSRMTVSQLMETIFGKAGALEAEVKDATPFTHFDHHEIGDVLEEYGFERNGEEVLYNGFTGEQFKVTIFIGPVYYQRLKHMVKDKVHARATGRVNNLTRQSVEGRSHNGGLRVGEMERDVLIAHGMSQFTKETYMDRADKFRVYIGKKSESIVVGNPDTDLYMYDNHFLNPEEVAEVQPPHAMKLLIQELVSMGIDFRIITEDDE